MIQVDNILMNEISLISDMHSHSSTGTDSCYTDIYTAACRMVASVRWTLWILA